MVSSAPRPEDPVVGVAAGEVEEDYESDDYDVQEDDDVDGEFNDVEGADVDEDEEEDAGDGLGPGEVCIICGRHSVYCTIC